jgi:hypothetical protein
MIQSNRDASPHHVEIVRVAIDTGPQKNVPLGRHKITVARTSIKEAVNEALLRLESIRLGQAVCLDRARCPRCAASLEIASLHAGRPRCSECNWPHPEAAPLDGDENTVNRPD